MGTETWLPVVGWPKYEVSNRGRVRSLTYKRHEGGVAYDLIMSTHLDSRGHVRVGLRKGEKKGNVPVHLAVLRAFEGMPPSRSQITEWINGDEQDNRRENLRYIDRSTATRRRMQREKRP